MASSPQILALLAAEEEPTQRVYQEIYRQIVAKPYNLSDLAKNDGDSALLTVVTQHGHRFTRLFDQIFSKGHQLPKGFPLNAIATETIALIQYLIANLHTDARQLVTILLPAVHACFTSKVPHVRHLASALIQYENLAELVVSVREGAEAIVNWVYSPVCLTQDEATLEAWTDKLVQMIQLCAADHHVDQSIARWGLLKTLKISLQELRQRHETQNATKFNGQNLPAPANMKKLTVDQKKSRNIQHLDSGNPSFDIDDGLSELLKQFAIPFPTSSRKLEEAMVLLEGERTIIILQVLVSSFPCNMCEATYQECISTSHSSDTIAEVDHNIPLPLQFDINLFGRMIGHWELLLSSPALSTFHNCKRQKLSDPIQEKLRDLAEGRHHQAKLAGSKSSRRLLKVPIYKTKCGGNLFILWQVDVDGTRASDKLSQIIRVWQITENDEIDKTIENVCTIQSTWSDVKISQCSQCSWTNDKRRDSITFSSDGPSALEDELPGQIKMDVRSLDPGLLGLLDKFYAFTEPVLQSTTVNDMAPELPYNISYQELQVVRHWNTPSLILGRSGTGKTTCLMFRLISKRLASESTSGDRPLRQILLTRSAMLAKKLRIQVRKTIQNLLSGSDDIEPSEVDAQEEKVRGFNKVTAMDMDDKFFPYVCTFENFLRILERTCAVLDRQTTSENRAAQGVLERSGTGLTEDEEDIGNCVDFATFKSEYWPRLPREITRRLPLSLVFSEIMGVIKGSAVSARSFTSLTCVEYLSQSSRIAPTFVLEDERARVYQAFEIYEQMKRERHQVDYVDRVISLLRTMRTNPSFKRILTAAVDELYIDEVQDQRSVDLELFLCLVRDSRCIHVAGDTAQAISQESAFRFADVKSLIYDHFAAISRSTKQTDLSNPVMFKLRLNYRSHHGIVALASFVMELLWKAFPQTIDKLEPEAGQLGGPMPTMFTGCKPDALANHNLDSSDLSAKAASFGAEQVILVRDQESKQELRKAIGNVGLVLTIVQSKGMEFNDVVLYDFFSSCPDPGGLRRLPLLLNADSNNFDSRAHVSMCTELKHLYVAVTRARKNLFLLESAHHNDLSPVIGMLTERLTAPLVKLFRRDDPSFDKQIQQLHSNKPTSPDGWVERGTHLMADGDYDDAYYCFERAADKDGMRIATAKTRRVEGMICLEAKDEDGAARAFDEAAALFIEANLIDQAVKVYITMKWFRRAAGELKLPAISNFR